MGGQRPQVLRKTKFLTKKVQLSSNVYHFSHICAVQETWREWDQRNHEEHDLPLMHAQESRLPWPAEQLSCVDPQKQSNIHL
jgi:hypothetical protein